MNSTIKILIIDDNPADASLLKRFLSRISLWTFDIKTALSGAEGFSLNEAFNADIVFVDYLLSGETGIDVIDLFAPKYFNTSFILLTGFGSESVVTKALRAGASDYLNKDELSPDTLERTLRHIVQKRQTEEKLRQTETKLKRIIENTDTGLVHVDEQLNIIEVNDPFLKLIGEERSDIVINQNITNWIENKHINQFQDAFKKCIGNGIIHNFETVFQKSEKKQVCILINATTEESSQGIVISALCRNITERKQYEKELKAAKIKAEESDRLKSAFLSNMSHEIRTPMNAIVGFSNLLVQDDILTDEERVEYLQHIASSGHTLLHLIDDIIDISKIVAEQIKIMYDKCYVNKMLQELFAHYKEVLKGNPNVELILNKANSDNDFGFITDQHRFKQIITNLLENAVKFTETGKIEYGYTIEKEIETKNNLDYIRFYVRDTGIGIPKDKQHLVFERFIKIDSDPNRIFRGSGLGLAISKSLVELMGGRIGVNSEFGKGSEFYFILPFTQNKGNIGVEKVMETKDTFNWEGKLILVAEDEDTNYMFLEILLRKTKAKIVWAKNGEEAVEFCNNNKVDIVLMDIKMPLMHGYEATKIIKSTKPETIIIAQTAYAMSGEREQIIQSGFDDYISKPIKKNELFRLIEKHFAK